MDPLAAYNKIQPMVIQDAKQAALEVYQEQGTKYGVAAVPRHEHNGLDAPNIPYTSLSEFRLNIYWTLPGITPATATNYGVFWIADAPCAVVGMMECHQTLGTNGGAVTLQLEKLTAGEAPDAGDALLVTAFDLKGTINTVVEADIITTAVSNSNSQKTASLLKGNRLCLKDAGTLTAVAGLSVVVSIVYQ